MSTTVSSEAEQKARKVNGYRRHLETYFTMFVPKDHIGGNGVIVDLTAGYRWFENDNKPSPEMPYFIEGKPRAKALSMATAALQNFETKTKTIKVDTLSLSATEGRPPRKMNPLDWFEHYLLSASFAQKHGGEKGKALSLDLEKTLDGMHQALKDLKALLAH